MSTTCRKLYFSIDTREHAGLPELIELTSVPHAISAFSASQFIGILNHSKLAISERVLDIERASCPRDDDWDVLIETEKGERVPVINVNFSPLKCSDLGYFHHVAALGCLR